jgi:hypothetical protein
MLHCLGEILGVFGHFRHENFVFVNQNTMNLQPKYKSFLVSRNPECCNRPYGIGILYGNEELNLLAVF